MSNGNKYLDLRQASLHHSTIHSNSHWTTHTGTTCTHAHSTQLYLHLHTCTPSHLHNTHSHLHTPLTTHYTHCSHNTHPLHFHIPTHTHYTQYTPPSHHTPTPTQTVAANMSGELHLRMEAEVVTATTYFKDLQNHQFGMLTIIIQSSTTIPQAA